MKASQADRRAKGKVFMRACAFILRAEDCPFNNVRGGMASR